jgi:hypothetical protein
VFCNEWLIIRDLKPPLIWPSLHRGSKSKTTDIKLPDKGSRSAKYVEAVEEEPEETELTKLNRKLRKDVSGNRHTPPRVARPRSNVVSFCSPEPRLIACLVQTLTVLRLLSSVCACSIIETGSLRKYTPTSKQKGLASASCERPWLTSIIWHPSRSGNRLAPGMSFKYRRPMSAHTNGFFAGGEDD